MRIFSLACLLLFGQVLPAAQASSLPLYVSGFLDRQSISLSGEKLQPAAAGVAIGVWIYEGIALEAELGVSLIDDTVATLALETESQLALGLRFESAPVNDVSAYALLSASTVSISSGFNSDNPASDSSSFSGVRGAFGLTYRFTHRWVADASLVAGEYGDDFGVSSIRIGARYTVNDVRPRKRGRWLR